MIGLYYVTRSGAIYGSRNYNAYNNDPKYLPLIICGVCKCSRNWDGKVLEDLGS